MCGIEGTKKFLLGEQPSQVDCSVFGMLSQFYWHGFGDPTEEAIKSIDIYKYIN